MKGPKRRIRDRESERTYAALRRQLEFDDMTHAQLFHELFSEAFDLPAPEHEGERAGDPIRVEQVADDRRPPRDSKKP